MKYRKNLTRAATVLFLILSALAYQNCTGFSALDGSSGQVQSASNGLNGMPTPAPSPTPDPTPMPDPAPTPAPAPAPAPAPTPSPTGNPTPPPQAVAAGFTKLAFSDDFTSNTFATSAGQTSGANWYYSFTDNAPQTSLSTTMTAAQVKNGNTDGGPNASPNGGIVSIKCLSGYDSWITVPGGSLNNGGAVQPAAGKGNWQHFYVEIYTQFNINTAPTDGTWPSFWAWSLEGLANFGFGSSSLREAAPSEVDFYESFGAQNYGNAAGVLASTLWNHGNDTNQSLTEGYPAHSGTAATLPYFDNNWHTIGSLWQVDPNNSAKGLVSIYVDNVKYGITASTGGPGSTWPLEGQHLFFIMPGGAGSPTYVDWVRVWQQP